MNKLLLLFTVWQPVNFERTDRRFGFASSGVAEAGVARSFNLSFQKTVAFNSIAYSLVDNEIL